MECNNASFTPDTTRQLLLSPTYRFYTIMKRRATTMTVTNVLLTKVIFDPLVVFNHFLIFSCITVLCEKNKKEGFCGPPPVKPTIPVMKRMRLIRINIKAGGDEQWTPVMSDILGNSYGKEYRKKRFFDYFEWHPNFLGGEISIGKTGLRSINKNWDCSWY